MQDLVGVRVPDARDHRLRAQHALDLRAPLGREDAREHVDREPRVERVGPEGRDALDILRIAHEVDREGLLRARLREVEARAVVEHEARGERALAAGTYGARRRVAPTEPPRPREMHEHVHVADGRV